MAKKVKLCTRCDGGKDGDKRRIRCPRKDLKAGKVECPKTSMDAMRRAVECLSF